MYTYTLCIFDGVFCLACVRRHASLVQTHRIVAQHATFWLHLHSNHSSDCALTTISAAALNTLGCHMRCSYKTRVEFSLLICAIHSTASAKTKFHGKSVFWCACFSYIWCVHRLLCHRQNLIRTCIALIPDAVGTIEWESRWECSAFSTVRFLKLYFCLRGRSSLVFWRCVLSF